MDIMTLLMAKAMGGGSLPFGEETITVGGDTLTWDGNTEGLVCVETGEFVFYKISDDVFTDEQIKSMTISASIGQTFVVADLWDGAQGVSIFATEDCTVAMMAAFARKDGAVCNGITFPQKGTYVASVPDVFYVDSIVSTDPIFVTTKTVVKTIDEKYLPDSVKGGGSGGRGLKTIEAATIEELHNKIMALDNPVLFRVTTDGYIAFSLDPGSGGHRFSNATAYTTTEDNRFVVTINELDASGRGAILDCVLENGEFFWDFYYFQDFKPVDVFDIDLSSVTKFTVYYF